MASQDIQPEESISQVDFVESASITSTSRATGSSSQSAFRSQFSSSKGLRDNFLMIDNDPVTLARSQGILKVTKPRKCSWLNKQKTFNWICLKDECQDAPWKGFHEAIQYDYASEADKKRGVTTTKAVMVCKQCRHTMLHPYEKVDKSNSSLWKHYRKHNSAIPLPPMTQSTIDKLFHWPSNMSGSELQRLLLETTVTCNWPFDQFEVEVFRYLMRRGYPGYNIPKRKTVRRHLTSGAEKAREEIKSRFENHDGHISLALDCWTSSNRWEFMGTTPPQCSMISVLKSTH